MRIDRSGNVCDGKKKKIRWKTHSYTTYIHTLMGQRLGSFPKKRDPMNFVRLHNTNLEIHRLNQK